MWLRFSSWNRYREMTTRLRVLERRQSGMTFDPSQFLDNLRHSKGYAGQIVHVQTLPPRAPRYGQLRGRLSPPVQRALNASGAERLYAHQAEAINAVLDGHNVVVATSTASGKTLAFNIPVLEALARDPLARALYLYPTKALGAGSAREMAGAGQGRGGRDHQPARRDVRRRHAPGRAGARPQAGARPAHEPGHAPRGHPAQSPAVGRVLQAPEVRGDRRGAHVPGRVRVAGGLRAAAAAPGVRDLPGGWVGAADPGVGHPERGHGPEATERQASGQSLAFPPHRASGRSSSPPPRPSPTRPSTSTCSPDCRSR